MSDSLFNRRAFLMAATAGAAGSSLTAFAGAAPASNKTASLPIMAVRQVNAGVLDIGYHEAGPAGGKPVILLHGYPYDIHSYVDVAPRLAAQGLRVIVPHLRGHGTTRFIDQATPRSGQQAAVGEDVIALMDALKLPQAVLAGYDWGGRAACVAAALHPERVAGLVSVNSYLLQDIAHAGKPAPAKMEASFWYQFYFLTERGRAGLSANRGDIARILWERNSPKWRFTDAAFERAAAAFANPDYVEVVLHSYRHRLGAAPGYPHYARQEAQLATLPAITVPTVTLDGIEDGVVPATDGTSTAAKFSGPRVHHQVPDAGHNLPQEAPKAFADAVAQLAHQVKWRTV